ARSRLLPVLPNAGDAEGRAILHRYRVGLLCLLTPDRPPFEEAVHWYNAAALAVRIAERRQVPHSLALGVDRLAPTCWIHTPVGNKAPAQRLPAAYWKRPPLTPNQRAQLPGRLSTLSILLVGPRRQTTLIASVCARSRPIELSAT